MKRTKHVPRMGKLEVGPGEQAPERPGHDSADDRAHRDPAYAWAGTRLVDGNKQGEAS